MARRNKGPQVAERKDRGWWGVFEYIDGNRHWHVSGLGSEREAQVALARIILEQGQRPADEITVGEILAYYLEHRAPQLASEKNALYFHDKIAKFWASKKLSEVTKANVRAYAVHANKEYHAWQKKNKSKVIKDISPAAVRRLLEHLKACLNFAVKEEIITVAPRISLPDKGKPKERWLTRQEAARLLRAARKPKYARTYLPHFIRIALRTGARKGAVLSLRWNQVDLEQGTVDFRPAQKSKTKGAAIVPIPDRQMPWFRALKRQGAATGFVVNKYGKPVKDIDKGFKEACIDAGLEDVTIHTLRHTYASWLKQGGASVSDIAEALGHKSTAMVDAVYGHMGESHISRLKKAVR